MNKYQGYYFKHRNFKDVVFMLVFIIDESTEEYLLNVMWINIFAKPPHSIVGENIRITKASLKEDYYIAKNIEDLI